ncbi:MAG: hypothetical protein EZS28_007153 [Streblomastix strix]|uniref:Uncharacterized protein n=1 Tax=Streblomastix strix TaxID=222440 RepID=A0A5J4WQJ0_9EUKA|nr:MAG: hypothetical protein EZS28_007153 [Streblomastix strix]
MKPYGGLIRLLDHSDIRFRDYAIHSIYAILLIGARQSKAIMIHPHAQLINQYIGCYKIYELFQRENRQITKDLSAVSIGLIYQAQEIPNQTMKQDIIAHLKSMLSTQNPYYREVAYQTLQGLSKNADNFKEIMRDVDFDDIADDMNILQVGTEVQINKINSLQIKHCLLLSVILERRKATEMRQNIIDSGIVNALLRILDAQPIDSIASEHVHALLNMIVYSNDLLMKQIYEMNALPILLKFVNHTELSILQDSTYSLIQMLLIGARSDNVNKLHQYFTSLQENGSIAQLIEMFKTSQNEFVKETSAVCLGILFKDQKIPNASLREKIVKTLKKIAVDDSIPMRSEAAEYALENLIIENNGKFNLK